MAIAYVSPVYGEGNETVPDSEDSSRVNLTHETNGDEVMEDRN